MLGEGIYPLAEVARYTQVPSSTLRTWFKPRIGRDAEPIFDSDYSPVDGDYAVSFLNLIEAYVASFFGSNGVKPRVIRKAHEVLQERLRTEHPFAHADLSTDGVSIIQHDLDKRRHRVLMDVISKNYLFTQMKSRLSRITCGVSSRMAEELGIAKGVVLNPRISFGKPVIEHTGLTTFVIANQYWANRNNAALVAGLFNITEKDVRIAARFESRYGLN
jgi:uncharacterized protein (DUF433 family)